MVWQDMAGLTAGRLPRFVKATPASATPCSTPPGGTSREVASQRYPDPAHSYT